MCDIGDALDLIHKWMHKTKDGLDNEGLAQADKLEQAILDLLNEGAGMDLSNGVKLLALFGVLQDGALHMEEHYPDPPAEPGKPVTIQ